MPSYKVHAAGAVVALVGVLSFLYVVCEWRCTSAMAAWMLIWTIMGGLFPDVDTKSKIQRPFYMSWCMLLGWLTYVGHHKAALGLAFVGYAPLLVHHRGLFHAWWLYAGIGLFILYEGHMHGMCTQNIWLYTALLSALGGALVHILLDRW